MCGRFTLRHADDIGARFQVAMDLGDGLPARFNVAPTQMMPIVVPEDGRRQVQLARWGLIPSWAKEASIGNRLINARAETLTDKPSFRAALKARRCLVPADGFFEWQATPAPPGGATGRGAARSAKTPYFIHRRDDGLFAFAGLYEHWRDPAGHLVTSYTIITTDANELMAPIHDRMPVILLPDDEADWLDPATYDSGSWRHLLRPYPADLLEVYSVSPAVNNPRHDDPTLVAPAG